MIFFLMLNYLVIARHDEKLTWLSFFLIQWYTYFKNALLKMSTSTWIFEIDLWVLELFCCLLAWLKLTYVFSSILIISMLFLSTFDSGNINIIDCTVYCIASCLLLLSRICNLEIMCSQYLNARHFSNHVGLVSNVNINL